MNKERHNWKKHPERVRLMFQILSNLKSKGNLESPKKWEEICKECADEMNKILKLEGNEKLRASQIQMQTLLPTATQKNRSSQAILNNLAIAIQEGYMDVDYFDSYVLKMKL
jgi:hypothetical protein